MLYKDLRTILETKIAPEEFKMTNEFYGLQYGEIDDNKQIKRILITLDINLEVIHYAIKYKVDFIISHHGFLKKPISYIKYTAHASISWCNCFASHRLFLMEAESLSFNKLKVRKNTASFVYYKY